MRRKNAEGLRRSVGCEKLKRRPKGSEGCEKRRRRVEGVRLRKRPTGGMDSDK